MNLRTRSGQIRWWFPRGQTGARCSLLQSHLGLQWLCIPSFHCCYIRRVPFSASLGSVLSFSLHSPWRGTVVLALGWSVWPLSLPVILSPAQVITKTCVPSSVVVKKHGHPSACQSAPRTNCQPRANKRWTQRKGMFVGLPVSDTPPLLQMDCT